jgi:putative transposase
VFPLTTVQTCIIHLIRNSLAFVSWKDRKLIMPDLKAIYRAETAEVAAAELDAFEAEWGKRYPAIGQACGEPGSMWCRCSLSRRRSAR